MQYLLLNLCTCLPYFVHTKHFHIQNCCDLVPLHFVLYVYIFILCVHKAVHPLSGDVF
jgi:hypothetical protein